MYASKTPHVERITTAVREGQDADAIQIYGAVFGAAYNTQLDRLLEMSEYDSTWHGVIWANAVAIAERAMNAANI